MRIDVNNIAPEPPEQGKPGRAGQTNSVASQAADTGPDKISISSDQAQAQTLTAQALAQPDVREARVQALQQSISNGEYSIPPSQIADALASEYGGAQG